MAQRTFVGVGWETRFAGGGSSIAISVNLEKIATLQKDDYGNVRLVVGERREQDERSRATHWVAVDDYHYRRSIQPGPPAGADAGVAPEQDEAEQLPF